MPTLDAIYADMNDPRALRQGTRLGDDLVISEPLGVGGMGAVYLAHDTKLDRPVAVKLLHDQASAARLADPGDRVAREARAGARVVHPNVAAVYRLGNDGGQAWLEMEWIDGPSLRDVLDAKAVPDASTAARWLSEAAGALQHAHDCGVIHCDVKPENMLLKPLGDGTALIKLVDFGLARLAGIDAVDRAQSQGTAAYIAPEAIQTQPGPAADQFALAVVACELLSGLRPTRARVDSALRLPIFGGPLRAAGVVIERALAVDPSGRFPTVADFADGLHRAIAAEAYDDPARDRLLGILVDILEGDDVTTAELVALPAGRLRALIQAVIAASPPGHPGLLRRVLGGTPPAPILADLRREGLIDGAGDQWQLAEPSLRDHLLGDWPEPARRVLLTAVARALEGHSGQPEWVREDAIRLYIAAGRLEEAARLVRVAASQTVDGQLRAHQHGRAIGLLSSPDQRSAWLRAVVEQTIWSIDSGWTVLARKSLADARGLVVELGLPADDPLAMHVVLAGAELHMLGGRPADAVTVLDRLLEQHVNAAEGHTVRVLAGARRAVALARCERTELALSAARGVLAETEEPEHAGRTDDLWRKAVGRAHGALGMVAMVCGQRAEGDRHVHRCLAIHLERGDRLLTARALVELGSAAFDRGYLREAIERYEEAREVLAPAGRVELAGIIDLNLGECALRQGRPFEAMRRLQAAMAVFDELQLAAHRDELLRLLIEACDVLGDTEGVAAFTSRRSDLRTSSTR